MATVVENWPTGETSAISPTDIIIAIQLGSEHYILGTATGISFSVSRRKTPIYALGFADPIAIGRGVRLISGVIDYAALRLSAVKAIMEKAIDARIYLTAQQYAASGGNSGVYGEADANVNVDVNGTTVSGIAKKVAPQYIDELPPVTLYIFGVPETISDDDKASAASYAKLEGVEFLGADWAITTTDVIAAERIEFIARHFVPWQKVGITTTT